MDDATRGIGRLVRLTASREQFVTLGLQTAGPSRARHTGWHWRGPTER
jgi:hypothetical protein